MRAIEAAVEFAGPGNYAPVLTGVLAGVRQTLPPMYARVRPAPR
ncbi:MAG TPA: hypothetical protein VHF25_05540 [Nitriliruptorales bacterium]|nr:hypothetical protein [Nitriliruptorales bacterium]